MSYEELALKAEVVAKVLDNFEKELTAAILDGTMLSKKETHKYIRHKLRGLRDELREEVIGDQSQTAHRV